MPIAARVAANFADAVRFNRIWSFPMTVADNRAALGFENGEAGACPIWRRSDLPGGRLFSLLCAPFPVFAQHFYDEYGNRRSRIIAGENRR